MCREDKNREIQWKKIDHKLLFSAGFINETQQHVTRDDKACMGASVHVSICILICVRACVLHVLVSGRMRWLGGVCWRGCKAFELDGIWITRKKKAWRTRIRNILQGPEHWLSCREMCISWRRASSSTDCEGVFRFSTCSVTLPLPASHSASQILQRRTSASSFLFKCSHICKRCSLFSFSLFLSHTDVLIDLIELIWGWCHQSHLNLMIWNGRHKNNHLMQKWADIELLYLEFYLERGNFC